MSNKNASVGLHTFYKEIWFSKTFRDFPPKIKCAYIFLSHKSFHPTTGPQKWRLDIDLMSFLIGEKLSINELRCYLDSFFFFSSKDNKVFVEQISEVK